MSTSLNQRLAIRANSTILLKTLLSFENIRNYVFVYVVGRYALKTYRHLRARGVTGTILEIWRSVSQRVALLALRLPKVKSKVDSEMTVAEKAIRDKLVKTGPNVIRHLALPREGRDPEWILDEMERMDVETGGNGGNDAWRNGKLSGAVYHGGKDMEDVILAAFKKYMVTNPLHPDSFPTVRKMEAEIVAMCLRMYNNPNGAGSTTSGGTESIITSCKTHRDWARQVKGITEPEMVIPVSGHTAFDKAGAYLGIKIHHIPVDPITRKVDVKRVARAINPNTIMLVGSAYNFPDGCQDDIVALAALAKRHKIGMHVDCCLGSFIVPFLEPAGFPVQPFDFRVEGVTAISCDTHKYGFAPKGSSVIMYRDKELRSYQYFVSTTWPGGVYASPTMAGSRPGSLIAATWAAMQYMGYNGYLESCRSIVGAAKHIEAIIRRDMKEIRILGNPAGSVIAFRSADSSINIYTVGDLMNDRGWHLNGLMNPAGLHLACTRLTTPMAEQFIVDLKECVEEAKGRPAGKGTMIQLYGLAGTSNVGGPLVSRLCTAFLDALTVA